MGMGSGWVHITPLPVPYPCFEIGENPYPYPNPVNAGKTRQIGVGMSGYPRGRVLLPCLVFLLLNMLIYPVLFGQSCMC